MRTYSCNEVKTEPPKPVAKGISFEEASSLEGIYTQVPYGGNCYLIIVRASGDSKNLFQALYYNSLLGQLEVASGIRSFRFKKVDKKLCLEIK